METHADDYAEDEYGGVHLPPRQQKKSIADSGGSGLERYETVLILPAELRKNDDNGVESQHVLSLHVLQ